MPGYYESVYSQRLTDGAGSRYEGTDMRGLQEMVENASWEERKHPDVAPFCKAYVTADISGGHFGLISVADMPDDTKFMAIDTKNTGKISVAVQGDIGPAVNETWLIVGPAGDDAPGNEDKQVVYTFHPGEPVRPSMVEAKDIPDGTVLTKIQHAHHRPFVNAATPKRHMSG